MQTFTVNGIELAYTRQGQGTPLVLIHGYPLDHSIWDETAALLAETFDLILPDLRGFGASASPGGLYTLADMASDLAGLLDGLGIQQAALAGHSMGGYVALAFARAYPSRLRGLGLVSSQVLADKPEGRDARYKTAASVAENGVRVVAEAMTPKLSADAKVQVFVRDLIEKQTPTGVIGALKAMAERPDSSDLLTNLEIPLVLVHGDADALIPIERAREVQAALSHAKLFTLSGVGHMPMLEAPPAVAFALNHLA
jgi:pimeloyl-ACP methyl ester carboxylesterase